jgi:hypothetical protein
VVSLRERESVSLHYRGGYFHELDEGVREGDHSFSTEQVTFGLLVNVFSSPDPVNQARGRFLGDPIDRPILTTASHRDFQRT